MHIPILILIVLGLVVLIVTGFWPFIATNVLSQSAWGLYSREFFENILVEAHGAVIDLFVVGIVLLWFEKRRNTADTIKSHTNSLDDLKLYRGSDASYRILGQMKRLICLGVDSFQLPETELGNLTIADIVLKSSNFRAANFSNTTLDHVGFDNCDFDAAIFSGARFQHVKLKNTRFRRVNFQGAKLNGCDFSDCDITRANFTNADLRSCIFRGVNCLGVNFNNADLRSANFIDAKNLDSEVLKNAKCIKHIKVKAFDNKVAHQ